MPSSYRVSFKVINCSRTLGKERHSVLCLRLNRFYSVEVVCEIEKAKFL